MTIDLHRFVNTFKLGQGEGAMKHRPQPVLDFRFDPFIGGELGEVSRR